MNILHLAQKPQLRGAEIFSAQLASHAILEGHKAIIVYLYPGESQLPFSGTSLCLNSRKWKRFIDIPAWYRLAAIIRTEKPNVIQANAGDTLKYAVFSKLLFAWKQPIIFRNASTISLYIKNRMARMWNGFFFRFAKKIVSVSRASATDFARLYPRLRSRIVIIPIGIESIELKGEKIRRHVNGSRPAGPVLVHVGGFTFEKNHIRLISIFEQILQKKPGAVLQLIGDGPLKKDIEAIAGQKKLNKHIRFYGFRNDAIQFIHNADVLVLPSIIEGLPAVITEAFYCRTPVVAYDVGGIGELVINNETGRLVPLNDEEAFVSAVLLTLEHNDKNAGMVENACRLVRLQYMNNRIAERFSDVYQSVTI